MKIFTPLFRTCVPFLLLFGLILPSLRGAIYYVRPVAQGTGDGSSWANARNDLQAIIDGAASGDQIWVAAGGYYATRDANFTYTPADDRTRTFHLKDGVAVYGGFAGFESALTSRDFRSNATYLIGNYGSAGLTSDNAYHVVTSVNDGAGTILDGFFIQSGNADGIGDQTIEGVFTLDNRGGGMYIGDGSPTIANCVFEMNLSGNIGGAMHIDGATSAPLIQSCVFRNNNSTANGAGISSLFADLQIENSVFISNISAALGGGVYLNASGATPSITNCTFYGNTATSGGALLTQIGSTSVVNCVIWGNTSTSFGGSINDQSGGNATVTYSLVEGGYTGTGNVSTDPLFANIFNLQGADGQWGTVDDGLHVAYCSPAVAAATASGMPGTDIAGTTRSAGSADLGAYEYSGSVTPLAVDNFSGTIPLVCYGAYSSLSVALSGGIGPFSYVISDGVTPQSFPNTTPGITYNPQVFGNTTYSLTEARDAVGCLADVSGVTPVVVSIYPIETANVGVLGNSTICAGSTVNLDVTGGGGTFDYVFDTGLSGSNYTPGTGIPVSPASTTTYNLISATSNATGCAAIIGSSQTITVISSGAQLHVKPSANGTGTGDSWANAMGSLQDAIDYANACPSVDAIWIAEGTYKPSKEPDGTTDSPRDFTFVIPNGVDLYGGFPSSGDPVMSDRQPETLLSILSGDLNTDDAYNSVSPGLFGQGENAHHVVVSVNQTLPSVFDGFWVFSGAADGTGAVTVNGFPVSRNAGGGMYLFQSQLQVKNTSISICSASSDGGAVYLENSSPDFDACFIHRNEAVSGNGGGFRSAGTNTYSVTNTVFWGNVAASGGGAYVSGAGATPTYEHCTFASNTASVAGGGMYAESASPNVINSILWGNSGGGGAEDLGYALGAPAVSYCVVPPASTFAGGTNVTGDPMFVNQLMSFGTDGYFRTDDDGLRLQCGSSAINTGNTTVLPNDILGNNRVMGSYPDRGAFEFIPSLTRLYVNINVAGGNQSGDSWANAMPSLANALKSITDCNTLVTEVWVASGIYYPEYQIDGTTLTPREYTFKLPDGVRLYGGFNGSESTLSARNVRTNTTTLSGDIGVFGDNADNCYQVVYKFSSGGSSTLDGFVIQDGHANGPGDFGYGGGIYLNGTSALTVSNCYLTNNIAGGLGGGIYASGGMLFLKKTDLTNNTANYGGGMASLGTTLFIANAVFSGNTANNDGGGLYATGSPGISNTVFANNTALNQYGGGMFTSSAGANVFQCTFYTNTAATEGGAIYDNNGGTDIVNSIFWGNSPAADEISGTGNSTTVVNSVVQSATPYAGNDNNVNTNPQFANPMDLVGADGDWRTSDDGLRLSCTSPGINSGNNSLLPDDFTDVNENGQTEEITDIDITGAARIQSSTVNMGAYEEVLLSGSAYILYVDDDRAGLSTGLTWGDAFNSLQDALDAVACNPVTEIWVAGGLYQPEKDLNGVVPGNPHTKTFMLPEGVSLYGGFAGSETKIGDRTAAVITANPAILSGDLNNDDVITGSGNTLTISNNGDNVYHVVVAAGLTANTRLDGFTITGGAATDLSAFEGRANGNQCGGGIYLHANTTYLSLRNLKLIGNAASVSGGGIFGIDGASGAIALCTFDRNMADQGAGLFNGSSSSPTLTDCSFINNKSFTAGGGITNADASSPTISNCAFRANDAPYGAGINNMNASNPAITQCLILDNSATVSGGGVFNNASSPSFLRTVISGNTAAGDGGGMVNAYSGTLPLLENCVISGNTAASTGGAILQYSGGGGYLGNCTIEGNSATGAASVGGGMFVDVSSSASVQNTILWNNTTPANTGDAGNEELACYNTGNPVYALSCLIRDPMPLVNVQDGGGNISSNPKFSNATDADGSDNTWLTADDGLALTGCSPAVDMGVTGTGTDILGNPPYDHPTITGVTSKDIGAYELTGASPATVLYVDGALATGTADGSSWANAFRGTTALQDALDAACTGTQVWVKAGTYLPSKDPIGSVSPSDPRDKTFFIGAAVSVYGGFAGTETALAQRTTSTILTHPTYLSGDFNSDDAGFTNNGENAYHVVLLTAAVTTLDGFIVRGGNADGSGGISVDAIEPVYRSAGGGMYGHYASNPLIKNCTFTSNAGSDGGGGLIKGTPANISDCVFSGNQADTGGGLLSTSSGPVLTNVVFSANTATGQGGGMYSNFINPSLTNVLFTGNTANEGGGMYNFSNDPQLVNVTLALNNAAYGGGVFCNTGNIALTNSLLWGNTASNGAPNEVQVKQSGTGTGFVASCIVQDGIPALLADAAGNTATDPLFQNAGDPDGADNQWMTFDDGMVPTRCGINTGAVLVGTDISGTVRVGSATAGAYESDGTITAVVGVQPETNTLVALNNAPSGNYRYANAVNGFSTEYGGNWSASMVLGAPNVYPAYNVSLGGQWSAAAADGSIEYLDLSFPGTAAIDFVDVYETFATGSVTQIEVYNPGSSGFETVYTATASPADSVSKSRVLHASFPLTAFPVNRVKITFDINVPDWNQIDAVAIGQADLSYAYTWSTAETTPGIVPVACGTYGVTIDGGSGCSDFADETYNFGDLTVLGLASVPVTDGDLTPDGIDGTDFGTSTTSQNFRISNAGGAMLSLTTLDITGTHAAMFSTGGITLPLSLLPGAFADFTLTYTSGGSGTHTATITINSNDCDEGAYDFAVQAVSNPSRLYVNDDAAGLNDGTSWTNAFTSLQSALEIAGAGDTIWVAGGTYRPSKDGSGNASPADPRDKTFLLPPGVILYGGFAGNETALTARILAVIQANPVILSGDLNDDDAGFTNNTENAYHVLVSIGATAGTRIDGFIIEGGNANNAAGSQTISSVPVLSGQGGGLWANAATGLEVQTCIFRRNYGEDGGAIFSGDAVLNVRQAAFEGNSAITGGGMSIYGPAVGLVENGVFTGNVTSNIGAAILVINGAETIQNSTMYQNSGGGTVSVSVGTTITSCVMYGNTLGGANDIEPSTMVNVSYTLTGIGLYAGTGNRQADPSFVNPSDPNGADNLWFTSDDGLQLVCGSVAENTGTGAGNDITGAAPNGTRDMGAYEYQPFAVAPSRLYVNQAAGYQRGDTWAAAFQELSTALACQLVTPSVTEIWVTGGTYTPTGGTDRSVSFPLRDGLAIYGSFAGGEATLAARTPAVMTANPSVLSGDIGTASDASDNSYHVVSAAGVGATAVLNGFMVKDGNANSSGADAKGGGLLVDAASPLVEQCIFQGNDATYGGGVAVINPVLAPVTLVELKDCTITGNDATNSGGGIHAERMGVKFTGVTNISGNTFGPGACE